MATAPVITNISVTEDSSAYNALTGGKAFIRGHNLMRFVVTVKYEVKQLTYDFNHVPYIFIKYGTKTIQVPYDGNLTYGEDTNTFTVVLTNVTSSEFTITATDLQNLSDMKPYEAPMIDYSDISVFGHGGTISTAGTWTIDYFGNFYNGDFGAVNNVVGVKYRYKKTTSSSWSSYTNISPTVSEYNFSGSITIKNLEYENAEYTVELAVQDRLTSSITYITGNGSSLFDWDSNDFQFNIPVVHENYVTMGNDNGIMGTTTRGEEVEILNFKSDDSLYLGYGSYANEVGTTYIYGNEVMLITNQGMAPASQIAGLVKAMSEVHNLSAYVSNVDGNGIQHMLWTTSSTCNLRGNCLYCRFYASGFSDYSDLDPDYWENKSDIEDFFLGRVIITHEGKITDLDYMTAVAGQSGVTAGLQMKNVEINSNTVAFDVYVCNSVGPMDAVLTTFNIPVTLNLLAF